MGFPAELKEQRRWIVWRDDKKPYSAVTMQPNGWQKPENWTTLAEAWAAKKKHGFAGVGFVFSPPYVGIDLDDCIEDDGMMDALAREITRRFITYAEYSKSGKGLHLYCRTTEPIKPLKTQGIEVYGDGRFFIATGKELDADQLEVTDQTENIKALLERYGVKHKASEQVRPETFPAGERNNRMAAEVGRLYRFFDAATVRDMAHIINKRKCVPPMDADEVDTIVTSIGKRDVQIMPAAPMRQEGWEHVEGLRNLDTKPYTGIAKPRGRYIPTGLPSIDYALNDLAPGCVTLVTGRSNAGKSVLVKQIAANAIGHDCKVFWAMGEGDQDMTINALYTAAIGRDRRFCDSVKINKRWHSEPKAFALSALKLWHKGKLTFFNQRETKFSTMAQLFEMIEHEVKTNGHDLVVLDNLMSLLVAEAGERFDAQADFAQRCSDIADIYKKHIILVLHPNKEYRKGEALEMEQISGTSDLYNKADNVLAVIREYRPDKIATGCSGKISLEKNRYYSDLPTIDTAFNPETGLLHEIDRDGNICGYEFGWMKYLDPHNTPSELLSVVQEAIVTREMGEE